MLPFGLAIGGALLTLFTNAEPGAMAQTHAPVLLEDHGSAKLARKIRAELIYLGLSVTMPPAARARLVEPLARGETRARIEIASPDRVVLSVGGDAEQAPGRHVFERHDAEGEAFAIRVAEEVRARLVDLGLVELTSSQQTSSASDAAAVATVRAQPPEIVGAAAETLPSEPPDLQQPPPAVAEPARDFSLWLDAGVATVITRGGIGPLWEGALGGHFASGDIDLGVVVLLPLNDGDVVASEGEAKVKLGALGAELGYARRIAPRWTLRGGAGAGLLLLSLHAEAAPDFVGKDDRLSTGFYYLHAGGAWRATPVLAFSASVAVGIGAPRPVLRFDERPVANLGPPLATLTLQAELGWPSSAESSP